MIKMSVYYPADGGSRFDHDYYRTRHMPLIQERFGDACLRCEIDKGLAGSEPGSAPAFVAACHIYSPSLRTLQEARGRHRAEIVADVVKYTDIAPIVQISEIVGG
ncbi:EthD family reductase [Phyllobacterium endophyticum]|uniref:EthD family reductase n=1 Tax=Phyllobacterium endophyticum TaxID=1149773 RepID=UPI0011CC8B3E|nr:EthD family reductase [Phyllobacterium endophyticum]TXR46365.1 EthD family reductase [Phyllobacterium endophyticum]